MRLPRPFIKLPLQFDSSMLQAEIARFSESDWLPHPQGYSGNSALILVSRDGGDNDDLKGAMRPTKRLSQCPYICQILACLNTVIGHSRLMRLSPGAEVSTHSDLDYYWHDRVRVHIPIVTDPSVRFLCDDSEVHMAAGEVWIFDNWRPHNVINNSDITRIHLVVDTVGSAMFWNLATRGTLGGAQPELIEFNENETTDFPVEQYRGLPVAEPSRVRASVQEILSELQSLPERSPVHQPIQGLLVSFVQDWQALWALYGPDPIGWEHFSGVQQKAIHELKKYAGDIRIPSNRVMLSSMIDSFFSAMLDLPQAPAVGSATLIPEFDRPIIILAAPRSGSTLLFETLSRHPDLWSPGDESHDLIESIPGLSPAERNFTSNALDRADLTPDVGRQLLHNFSQCLTDHRGSKYQELTGEERPEKIRFLEKTPKNSLRIPFFDALFPDALFLFLYRDPASNISSMIEAWQSGRFVNYPDLPGWDGLPWSLLLPEGWHEFNGKPLAEIATHQWLSANRAILTALQGLPTGRWKAVSYQTLIDEPNACIARICDFAGLSPMVAVSDTSVPELPLSRYTLTPPDPDKWRKNAPQLEPVLPSTVGLDQELRKMGNYLL